jgi:gliding motility-associated-like protein
VWTLNPGSCDDDIDHYEIYYTPVRDGNYELIATISDGSILTYNHTNLNAIAGCYKLIAIDSLGNASTDSLPVCVDTCSEYVLPSVFTPDGDMLNDFFHPCDSTTSLALQELNCPPYRNVRDVEMTIFNRWGNIVYETTNRDILWNGKEQDSGKECPDGIYYYTCKVNFYTLNGIEPRVLTGFVHIVRGKK